MCSAQVKLSLAEEELLADFTYEELKEAFRFPHTHVPLAMSCVFRQYLVNLIPLIFFFSMLFDADGEGTISVATFRVSTEHNIFQKIVKVILGATRRGT